ncbi:hypothetical protein [Streptomyces atratus]|uniref:hypothetical protein n=1 Tax=Streptomyces atratus TaxID=1893 RepID=UPI0033DB6391
MARHARRSSAATATPAETGITGATPTTIRTPSNSPPCVVDTPWPDTGTEATLQWLASPEGRRGSMCRVSG